MYLVDLGKKKSSIDADDVTTGLAGTLLLTKKTGRAIERELPYGGMKDERETVLVLAPGQWVSAVLVR